MIYLIWWTPRCGKSTIAKAIAKKLEISYMQTDHISSAIWSKITEEEERRLFGEKRRDDTNRVDNETRFSVFSNEEQLDHYRIRAERHRQGIKNIINYMIEDEESFVLEWFHLRPEIIAEDLQKRWENVKYIALYKSNKDEIEQGIKANKHPNDRATKTTFKEETYAKIASLVYDFGQVVKQGADSHGLMSYDMSQWDFQENLNKVVELMVK